MPLQDLANTVVTSNYVHNHRKALMSDPDYLMSIAEYESLHDAVCAATPMMPNDGPLYNKERRLIYRKTAPQALTVLKCRDDLCEMLVEVETKFVGLVKEWHARVNVRQVIRKN